MKCSEHLEDTKSLQDKLLEIIQDGDAIDILAEEYASSLNALMKAELIEIHNEKLQLTAKGLQAKIMGVENFLSAFPMAENKIPLKDISEELSPEFKNRPLVIVLFFLLITLIALVVFVTSSWEN